MIRTVIFDVGEVLFRGCWGVEILLSRACGRTITNKEFHTPELLAFFAGQITERDLWAAMIRHFNLNMTISELKRLVRSNFAPIPGTMEVAIDLKRHKYRLGILSVHGREWVRYINSRHCYHRHFDYLSYSYYTGVRKPEDEAFLSIAHGMQTPPERCLFIDDYEVNIEAARKLGFRTHQFISAEMLRTYLLHEGLLLP